MPRERFESMVARIIEYIYAGDAYQVVPSQRWSAPVPVSQGDVSGVQRVNVDVVARGGNVYVAYGTRTQPTQHGGFVQQHEPRAAHHRPRDLDEPSLAGPEATHLRSRRCLQTHKVDRGLDVRPPVGALRA